MTLEGLSFVCDSTIHCVDLCHQAEKESDCQLVSWCFEPSQPRRTISGLGKKGQKKQQQKNKGAKTVELTFRELMRTQSK